MQQTIKVTRTVKTTFPDGTVKEVTETTDGSPELEEASKELSEMGNKMSEFFTTMSTAFGKLFK